MKSQWLRNPTDKLLGTSNRVGPRSTSALKGEFPNRKSRLLGPEGKLKSIQLPIDKEQLYEENLYLKLNNNALQDEVLKLKTKLTRLGREGSKKDEVINAFKSNGDKLSTNAVKKM